MMEQIQVQKSQMHKRLISSESEAALQIQNKKEHEEKLKEISDHIRTLEEESRDMSSGLKYCKKSLPGRQRNSGSGRPPITVRSHAWNL